MYYHFSRRNIHAYFFTIFFHIRSWYENMYLQLDFWKLGGIWIAFDAIQLFLSFLDEMYCPWHIYHSNVNNLTVFWPLYSILSCWYFTKRCRYFAHIFAWPSLCLILLRVISCSSKPKLILIEAMLNYLLMSRLFLACIARPKYNLQRHIFHNMIYKEQLFIEDASLYVQHRKI